jgi:hypothetical protein
MLIAPAQVEGFSILTADPRFKKYDVKAVAGSADPGRLVQAVTRCVLSTHASNFAALEVVLLQPSNLHE